MFRVLIRVLERERAFFTESSKHCPEDITHLCYEPLLFAGFIFKRYFYLLKRGHMETAHTTFGVFRHFAFASIIQILIT